MKYYFNFLTFIFLLFFWQGCKEENPVEPPSQNQEIIISSDAKVLSDSLVQESLISISQDSSIFIFSSGNNIIDNLEINDYIVSEKDLGFLRKIISVQKSDNKITLNTLQASITDIVQRGNVSITKTLSPENILKENFTTPGVVLKRNNEQGEFFYEFNNVVIYDIDNNLNTEDDQIVLNGSISLEPAFTFTIEIDNWKVRKLTISNTFREQINLSSSVIQTNELVNKDVEIASYRLKPILYYIGIIPVVITPNLIFKLHFNGEITASVETNIKQTAEITAGITYTDNGWNPFSNESHNFEFQPPTFRAGIKVEANIGPEFNLMLYGVVGPYAYLSLFGDLNVEVFPEPKASLYAGIRLQGGVYIKILSHTLLDQHFPEILGIREKVWEQTNLGGKVSGIVRDAITNAPLSGCDISAYKDGDLTNSITTNSDGTYELSLPVYDSYKIIFTKNGYIPVKYYNVSVGLFDNIILETVLQIDQNFSGTGNISGTIKNALTGFGVDEVTLYLREGINVTTGPYVASTNTNSTGYFQFINIYAGNYTVEAIKSGFNTTFFTVICLGGLNNDNQNATISPVLNQEEIRIILTWGEDPPDLDSHLTGPLQNGDRFHMYYPYAESGSPWPSTVNLDLDDIDSFGPETTTLYEQISGIYRFSVHDFSNRNSFYSLDLSNSNAQVRVYGSNGLLASFNIPPNNEGTLWVVFEMSNGVITPINRISYASNPEEINKPFEIPKNELKEFPKK